MKQLLAIIVLTTVVWIGIRLSEKQTFPIDAEVDIVGYDSTKYAVVSADSVFPLQVMMSNISALWYGITHRRTVIEVELTDNLHQTIATSDLYNSVRYQIGVERTLSVTSPKDSLRFVLAEMKSKRVAVDIDNLQITFYQGYGLYGNIKIVPDSVTFYGDEKQIREIKKVGLEMVSVQDIDTTMVVRAKLMPIWEKCRDVYVSDKSVDITIPTTRYVEEEFECPIRIDGGDGTLQTILYPAEVKVRVWIAEKEVERVSATDFDVAVQESDILSEKTTLEPRMMFFPTNVRVRSIEPKEVQYITMR